jgi:hypothetical protein
MSQPRVQDGCLSLEANAVSAGIALACAYSSSDEYEAELIQARRKAGAYGSPHRQQAYVAFAAAATMAAAIAVACLAI